MAKTSSIEKNNRRRKLSKQFAGKRVVCIVSGGNIDPHRLATILGGGIPE